MSINFSDAKIRRKIVHGLYITTNVIWFVFHFYKNYVLSPFFIQKNELFTKISIFLAIFRDFKTSEKINFVHKIPVSERELYFYDSTLVQFRL